jgi:hypothetical protein
MASSDTSIRFAVAFEKGDLMERREFLKAGLATTVAASCREAVAEQPEREPAAATDAPGRMSCDVFVYGSTPGGIAAAVEAARRGCRVVLACPKSNPGGMAASGLCTTDAVRRGLFGGLVEEFISKVRGHYLRIFEHDPSNWKLVEDGWHYEPSVAEKVMREILEGEHERLAWLPGHWLNAATVEQGRITEISLERPDGNPLVVTASTFIDCTYEGDLAARSDVPYRVGREGRDEYGESLAGIHYRSLKTGKQLQTPDTGEPSVAIQAFCARSIMTDDPEHRIPVEKPDTYEQHLQDYLPLLQDIAAGRVRSALRILHGSRIPRRKFQLNGRITAMTSINCPGVSWTYPEAGRRHRDRLDDFHRDHVAGMLYFLQHHKQIPPNIAKQARTLGLHDQEFVDNHHWPWQLYVRQGRRIEGREIVTQHNFIIDPRTGRTPRVEQPIAMGEYSFDVHPCHDRRFAVEGLMEGVLSAYPRKKSEWIARPGQIPYGAMLPRHLNNLLVPVAMSSTHVAMSVLRMEPVWMTTGQVAGLAAATAQENKMDVALIDPVPLPKMLRIRTKPGE